VTGRVSNDTDHSTKLRPIVLSLTLEISRSFNFSISKSNAIIVAGNTTYFGKTGNYDSSADFARSGTISLAYQMTYIGLFFCERF
jgi:hypothetical protein